MAATTATSDPRTDEQRRPQLDGDVGAHRFGIRGPRRDEWRGVVVRDVRVDRTAGDERDRAERHADREAQLVQEAQVLVVAVAVLALPRDRLDIHGQAADAQRRTAAEAA